METPRHRHPRSYRAAPRLLPLVLWYTLCLHQQVLLVIVRDPTRKQPDDFFFTTDLDASAADVASLYWGVGRSRIPSET